MMKPPGQPWGWVTLDHTHHESLQEIEYIVFLEFVDDADAEDVHQVSLTAAEARLKIVV
jgi:hypothetical protein